MMKKLGALFLLLLVPFVSAISTDLVEVYQPGQTVVIEIFGNILEPIVPEDIELKRNNVQVPFEYDVKRLGESYYLYFITPPSENNYTLLIHDVATTVNGVPETIEFNQSFSTVGEQALYDVKPGVIVADAESFSVDLFLNSDLNEPIVVDFPQESEVVLKPGSNTIEFSTEGVEPGLYAVSIGMYVIPVLIVGEDDVIPPVIDIPQLRFFPNEIETVILVTEEFQPYPFSVVYTGEEVISEFELIYDEDIFIIEPASFDSIVPNESIEFNLSVINQGEAIDEVISLSGGGFVAELPVFISYTEDEGNVVIPPVVENNGSQTQGYYCSELGGRSCTADEVCSTSVVESLDVSSCCLGICAEDESGSLAWIGYLIGAIVLIIIVIILGRYFKTRSSKKDPLKKRLAEVRDQKKSGSRKLIPPKS